MLAWSSPAALLAPTPACSCALRPLPPAASLTTMPPSSSLGRALGLEREGGRSSAGGTMEGVRARDITGGCIAGCCLQ
jgi:hypothetical protein